eukprot:PhM_4_TR2858/c1_g1_i1/m.92819
MRRCQSAVLSAATLFITYQRRCRGGRSAPPGRNNNGNSNSNSGVDDDFVVEALPTNLTETSPEGGQHDVVPSGQNHIMSLAEDVARDASNNLAVERSRRMQVMYDLTHPKPENYTFAGKLVPPPPLEFGVMSEEAKRVAGEMIVRPQYSPVQKTTMYDPYFEMDDLYMEVAFVGRANSGKSSLLNSIVAQQRCAKSSSTPGSTRYITFYQSVSPKELRLYAERKPSKLVKLPGNGLQFTFVDLPGWGIKGMKDTWTEHALQCNQHYLSTRRSLNMLIFCKDATEGWTATDDKLFDMIHNSHGMCYLVLTKCDAIPHPRLCQVMAHFYKKLTQKRWKHHAYPLIVPTSSATGENIDFLRGLIVETSGVIQGTKLRVTLQNEERERLRRVAMEQQSEIRSGGLGQSERHVVYDDEQQQHHQQQLDVPRWEAQYDHEMALALVRRGGSSSGDDHQHQKRMSLGSKNVTYETPYGGTVKANLGLGSPVVGSSSTTREEDKDDLDPSMPIMDVAPDVPHVPLPPKLVEAEAKLRQLREKRIAQKERAVRASGGALVQVESDGTVSMYHGGKKLFGPQNKRHPPTTTTPSVRRNNNIQMSRSEQEAYRKHSGRTLEGEAWDRYVDAHRGISYTREGDVDVDATEGRIRRSAQPPGLFRDYGFDPATFSGKGSRDSGAGGRGFFTNMKGV